MFAVIAAHNEAPTIAHVVRMLEASDVFDGIIVVDDGSTDATAQHAADAGADVVVLPRNVGKGGAMRVGYQRVPAADDRVAFFDADLVGLTPEHPRAMTYFSAKGYDMVSLVQPRRIPIGFLGGQRIVRRWVLEALPDNCWRGYCIETAMNDVVERNGGKSVRITMPGMEQRTRLEKGGLLHAVRGHLGTIRAILAARRALQKSGGTSCQL